MLDVESDVRSSLASQQTVGLQRRLLQLQRHCRLFQLLHESARLRRQVPLVPARIQEARRKVVVRVFCRLISTATMAPRVTVIQKINLVTVGSSSVALQPFAYLYAVGQG